MWYNEKLDPQDILENPQLKGSRAVRDSQVYELPEVFGCDFWTLKLQPQYSLSLSGHTGAMTQQEAPGKQRISMNSFMAKIL